MKLLIIGGTGATGRELIKQALEQGHQLTALVRNPEKLKLAHPNLLVVKGNVLDRAAVENVVKGQDAVLSALGHKKFIVYSNILSTGTRNIASAMEKHAVQRFICISSLGIGSSRFKMGLYYTLFVIPFILAFYFLDKARQEKIIRSSKLNWTIVRPAQLTNGKLTGNYAVGENIGNYIITKLISRANVAHFMLSLLTDNRFNLKTPGISNK